MADVRSFRAVRYARPSAAVTAPPYDVIDDAARRTLAASDQHNVVNLTLEDAETAAARYHEWLDEGVLVREDDPAVWWMEQDYVDPRDERRTRSGITASLRAEPYSSGSVLPHERTHRGPIEGRLRLLRTTRVQLEPIFLLYDHQSPFGRPERAPDIDVGDTRLWRLDGDGVAEFFDGRQLLIADGHHRYETAVAFAAEDGADRLLVVLVSTSDPGLDILPTHRVFTERPDIEPEGEAFGTVEDAVRALEREPAERAAAVAVLPDEARLLRGVAGELDVELVDRFGDEGITYTPDLYEAERRVRSGEASAALLVRAPRIEDVYARARQGTPLPPKTTYFFPKLVSGLLFLPVDS